MPEITITDSVHATATVEFSDSSPLGLSKLTGLKLSNLPIIGDFKKPIDQCSFDQVEFGPKFIAPSRLLGPETKIVVQGSETGVLSIRNSGKQTLFDDDGFSPAIPILDGECWIGLELQLNLTANVGASFNGFGVAAKGSSTVGAGTHVLLQSSAGKLPDLSSSLKTIFTEYSAARSAAAIHTQPVGLAYTLEASGSIKFSGSYSLPIDVNPLASFDLPFNYQLHVDPDITVRIGGEIALNGTFVVRSYKRSAAELILGVYKKRNTTLAATFEAGAGIGAGVGETDLVAAFLGAVFPAVDTTAAAGFTEEESAALEPALSACVDHSLSIAANASCAASKTDEAAIVYSINLAAGDLSDTDKAIDSAFHGDWTLLAALPNASPVRNICREIHDRKHKMTVNLLGLYNAGAITDYLKSCTVLHDDSGQVTLINKVQTSRVAVAGAPYRADTDKLRSALAEAFLATVTYGASAPGNWHFQGFTVQQNYVNYKAEMSAPDLRQQMLLGRALKLIPDAVWNKAAAEKGDLGHVKTCVNARYDTAGVLRLFYSDPVARTGYSRAQLERVGRNAKAALLGESGPRLTALQDDATWKAMSDNGNIGAFSTIPQLHNIGANALGAIGADWADITWWVQAMLSVTPKLNQVLHAADTAGIPDRKALADAFAKVATKASSAFGDGWGLLTMFQLSSGAPALEMNMGWDGKFQHYQSLIAPAATEKAAASRA